MRARSETGMKKNKSKVISRCGNDVASAATFVLFGKEDEAVCTPDVLDVKQRQLAPLLVCQVSDAGRGVMTKPGGRDLDAHSFEFEAVLVELTATAKPAG